MSKKPEIAIIDLDSILFQAANAGQVTWRVARDDSGKEICRYSSVAEYNGWLQECEILDMDIQHGYKGNVEDLVRETEYEYLDVEKCYKTFDHIIDTWVKQSGCSKWKGWMGAKAGQRNFRYDIATLFPYKHGREKIVKPYYLEDVRAYARKNPNCVTVKGAYEADDLVVANAEKRGEKACLVGIDKDSVQVRGSWFLLVDQHDKPIFSDPNLVGKLWKEGKKVYGWGNLFLLWQMLKGDKSVDGIVGVPGVGDVGAYNTLKEFSGKPIKDLPEAIDAVAGVYKKVFGEEYNYKHCYTNEDITAHWKDLFEENLRLLWMKRYKDDVGEDIMRYLK